MKQYNFLFRKISKTENKPFIVSIEGNIGRPIIKFCLFLCLCQHKGLLDLIGADQDPLVAISECITSRLFSSFADPDLRSSAFLTPGSGSGIRDKHLGSYFHIFGSKIFNFLCKTFIVADPDPGSGMENLDSGWKNSDPGQTSRIRTSAFWDPKNFGVSGGMLVLSTYKKHRCCYSQTTEILQLYIQYLCRVADLFDVDPDPAFNFDADLDSAPTRSRSGYESSELKRCKTNRVNLEEHTLLACKIFEQRLSQQDVLTPWTNFTGFY